jgi:hypothetical protein
MREIQKILFDWKTLYKSVRRYDLNISPDGLSIRLTHGAAHVMRVVDAYEILQAVNCIDLVRWNLEEAIYALDKFLAESRPC